MKYQKTIIAYIIASLLPNIASSANLVVTPDSPDQISAPVGPIDNILFETNGTDIEKSLGQNKDIDKLEVTNGLAMNEDTVWDAKVVFNMSAKEMVFGGNGIEFGSSIPLNGHLPSPSILNIEADSFTSIATGSGKAIIVDGQSAVNVGGKEARVHNVLLKAGNTSALYSSEQSSINVFGDDITIESASDNSYASTLYTTSEGSINLDASNNLTVTNTGGSTSVAVKQSGDISLSASNKLVIAGTNSADAVSLEQSDGKTGHITLTGDSIDIAGTIKSNGGNVDRAKIEINAHQALVVNASSSESGAISVKNKSTIDMNVGNFSITNESQSEKSSAIDVNFKNGNGGQLLGQFAGTGTLKGVSGLFNSNGKVELNGMSQNSNLVVSAGIAGILTKSREGTQIKDSSYLVQLRYDKPIEDKWYSPIGTDGLSGLGSVNSSLILENAIADGKQLAVDADVDVINQKTSGLLAVGTYGSKLSLTNFESVDITVKNKGAGSSTYGIRSVSGIISGQDLGTLDVTVANGWGIYSSSYGAGYSKGNIELSASKTFIDATGVNGVGIEANDMGYATLNVKDVLSIVGQSAIKVASQQSNVSINAETIDQGLIKGDWTVDEGKIVANLGSNTQIEGALTSTRQGTIDLTLKDKATLIGSTSLGADNLGVINVKMGQGSVWHMTDNSVASSLNFNGTTINFSQGVLGSTTPPSAYHSLTTKTFEGNGNTLLMRIDLANEASDNLALDQMTITDKAQGTHVVGITIEGKDLVGDKMNSVNWLVSQGADSHMTITNAQGGNTFSGRGMLSVWSLSFVANGEEDKLTTDEGRKEIAGITTGVGEGDWYLVRTDIEEPDPKPDPDPDPKPDPTPDPDPLPPEVNDNLNMGTSAAQAMGWLAEKSDLRKRLGEIRYGSQAGAWAKVDARQERVGSGHGFKSESYGIHVGYDTLVATKEASSWLVGGALRYSNSDQEGLGITGNTGELDQYSAKLYGTWMHEGGSYADLVLQAGYYDQSLSGLDNVGTGTSKAYYDTFGVGASIEVGHMFTFANAQDDRPWFNHWFIEPQVELSYFYSKGENYKTSTGLMVDQGNADFFNARAGFVLGKKFNLGSIDSLDKRYFQLSVIGGVNHEFLGDQTIRYKGVDGVSKSFDAADMDGTRFYYGIDADWQMTQNLRAYARIEREEGNAYTKDYDVSIGVKYQF